MSLKRVASVDGFIRNVGIEQAGTSKVVATAQFDTGKLSTELNLVGDPLYEHLALRAADVRWLGARVRLTVSIEILP